MFELGDTTYVFTRIVDYEGSTPDADESVVSQAERADGEPDEGPARGKRPWSQDKPERWTLAPLPSTNPGAHKEPGKSWSLETFEVAPSVMLWAEPLRRSDYKWELGGRTGNGADLETMRFGASGFWAGFFAEAAFVTGGKSSGSLVTDGTSLSALKLKDGDGWHVAAGYKYAFVIDGPWSANLSVFCAYDSISATLSASTTEKALLSVPSTAKKLDGEGDATAGDGSGGSDGSAGSESDSETGETNGATDDSEEPGPDAPGSGSVGSDDAIPASPGSGSAGTGSSKPATTETKVAGYEYKAWSKDVTLDEIRVGLGGGIEYNEWYWGVDCWTDSSLDVSIPVLGSEYDLEAKRAQPISFQAGLWYCPMDNWLLEATVSVGSETVVRLGTGFFF